MNTAIQLIFTAPDPGLIYPASYNPIWVTVSVLLSMLASYAALSAAARIEYQLDFKSRLTWIAISSFTLGIGVWAMHFIGMLALALPCLIYYDPLTTVLSMVPAILSSGIALGVVKSRGAKRLSPLLGSLLLGAGIGAMHYTGMAAMHLEGEVRYDPALFAVSILVAVALSYLALRMKQGMICAGKGCDALVAAIMGAAISGMHYSAMAAAYFVRGHAAMPPSSVLTTSTLAILIAIITVFLALSAMALAAFSRNREITSRLRDSEERWKFALEGAGDGVWDWNVQTDEAVFSKRWKEMIGYAEHEFPNTGAAWSEHLHADDKDRVLSILNQYLTDNHAAGYTADFRMRCKDGSWKWILARGKVVKRDADNKPVRMLGTHTDITESKQAEIELRIAATAFESQEGMIITDADWLILRVNQAFTKLTGYSAEEVIGKNPRILNSGHDNADFFAGMKASINRVGTWEGDIWNRRKDNKVYPQHYKITAIKNADGVVTNYVSTITDITMSEAAADEIQRMAFYDPLTGLPNRQLLRDRLKLAQASSYRSGRKGAVLFIDMDNFKTLNDTLGHDIGDLLLQHVANRLIACVREGDTVARLGGDEFVVVLEALNEDSLEAAVQAEVIGNKILAALNQPYQLSTHEYRNTPSIGGTLIVGHTQSMDELLKQADMAMYQAKAAGRNTLRFFEPQTRERDDGGERAPDWSCSTRLPGP